MAPKRGIKKLSTANTKPAKSAFKKLASAATKYAQVAEHATDQYRSANQPMQPHPQPQPQPQPHIATSTHRGCSCTCPVFSQNGGFSSTAVNSLTVNELRKVAQVMEISGRSKLRTREQLIKAISGLIL